MKLAKKHGFPHVVNISGWVFIRRFLNRGNRSQLLDIPQHDLGLSVVVLVVGLGCVGTSVEFKVQLAVPRWELPDLGTESVKEVINRETKLQFGDATDGVADSSTSSKLLKVLPSRTASTVALAKDKKRRAIDPHSLVLRDTPSKIAKIGLGRVGLRRGHMADDLAAIRADPHESGVGEVVDVVPAQLLGHETIHASQPTELRKLARVSKCIR